MAEMKHPDLMSRLGGIGDAFADGNFRIYSIGSFSSWISFFVQIVAVSWLTWELTGSTVWLAVMALLDIVPNVLLLPLGGAIADRFDRLWVMNIAHALLLVQAAVMAVLSWAGLLTIWPLAILVLIHGTLLSFSVPAMFGMLPRFVAASRLSSAFAVNSSYAQLSVFVGPALAGWIIVDFDITTAFVINVLGYGIHLTSTMFLRTPAGYVKPAKSRHTVVGDMIEGV
ncbi:MAG: MFS transporter, partial [Rhodospirillaceae bacterium]|nr:MFS transporter [Rhodospirillaceae bacterium]